MGGAMGGAGGGAGGAGGGGGAREALAGGEAGRAAFDDFWCVSVGRRRGSSAGRPLSADGLLAGAGVGAAGVGAAASLSTVTTLVAGLPRPPAGSACGPEEETTWLEGCKVKKF